MTALKEIENSYKDEKSKDSRLETKRECQEWKRGRKI